MAENTYSHAWLTARRLRAHGLILGLALWSIYLWTLATPGLRDRYGHLKGTDFLHFYTLGTLAKDHRGAELYDMNAQTQLAAQRVPAASGLRYLPLYPPQVSILFAPLARLPYGWALATWWTLTCLLYGLSCYAIWRECPTLHAYGWLAALLAMANPAFFHLIAWGQTSALALAGFTLAWLSLRRKRHFLAGVFLGLLAFKPQLALASGVIFLAIGAWRILGGAMLSAAAESLAGILYYGIDPFRSWLRTMWNARALLPWLEPRPYQTHCLRTFWSMLVPWADVSFALYLISAVAVLAITTAVWKRADSLSLRFSALLLASVLVAPHLTVYDLVVLVPALLLFTDWLLSASTTPSSGLAGWLLYLVFLLPLLGPLARWTHVQLSVIAMAGLLYVIWQVSAPDLQPPVNQATATANFA